MNYPIGTVRPDIGCHLKSCLPLASFRTARSLSFKYFALNIIKYTGGVRSSFSHSWLCSRWPFLSASHSNHFTPGKVPRSTLIMTVWWFTRTVWTMWLLCILYFSSVSIFSLAYVVLPAVVLSMLTEDQRVSTYQFRW